MIGLNNKKIGFIVDSSCNIKDGDIEDVKVVPLGITIQVGDQIKTYKDGVDLSLNELLNSFNIKESSIKTSQAAMPDMIRVAQEMCSKYDQVFVFPIHKELSSNLNSWRLLKDDFPNLNIISSCDVGRTYLWTIQDVKNFLTTHEANEADVQKFVDENIIGHHFALLMVEDLTQLIKGGRVKGVKALIAKLFKIKPIVLVSTNGLESYDRAKDYEDLFQMVDKYVEKNYPGKKILNTLLFVPYNDDDTKTKFIDEFSKHYPGIQYDVVNMPTVVMCHTGPKYVAVYVKI